jgi:glycosyltransferase involved in cell wall biosynthesis
LSGLRIAIDARLTPTAPGGVLQVVIGMAHGLSQLTDGDEKYSFLVEAAYDGWLDAYVGDNCRIVRADGAAQVTKSLRNLSVRLGLAKLAVPKSDGMIERHGFDGIHFLLPMGFRTCLPSVYQIHDLQHLHFPEYFHRRTRLLRDAMYNTLCGQASRIFTMTNWGKLDLVKRLRVSADKVTVVPWGSVLNAYSEPSPAQLDQVRNEFGLAEPFAFYPAKAYPHKNHKRLLQAVARLRDVENLRVPLILSGADGAASATIEKTIAGLRLEDQVRHLGFVDGPTMAALFNLCHGVVFPSLFEGWGLPVTEAMSLQKPIACADATCLPEVARDAAVYFDPYDVPSIAEQIARVWTDNRLRDQLQQRAVQVAGALTWENTARQFRSHYRNIFGAAVRKHTAAA